MSPKVKFRVTSIFFLSFFCILAYLGTWQLYRAQEKKNIILQMQERMHTTPIMLSSLVNPELEKFRFTPVVVYGIYLNKYTFLLDNQILNKQAGYRVITVVQSPSLEKWVLVDRGWIARGKDRQKLPEIKDVYGMKTFVGIINTISSGIVLEPDKYSANSNWPIVIQSLDLSFIAHSLHHNIYDFVVQLEPADLTTYKNPPINFGISSNKHLGYAIQWYFFACLTLVYYLYFFVKQR